ncbi:MAG: MBOAT family protein [Lachnospiraceae bacterium]|nr:MBOAT family protein [Lachnospiraceae bacterium]
MVFSTIIFLCAFLPVTIIGYYCMPKALKNYFLLLASLFFYAWGEPRAVVVMLISIVCNYLCGILIAKRDKSSKLWLTIAVLVNLGILFVFKYVTFVSENLHRLSESFPLLNIALPIGISFYTFQGLSYVIDVYRGDEVQKNPFSLALYISMFPQLIAGPIVRYSDVRSDLSGRKHSVELFSQGVTRFTMGLAKKAILANRMGALADQIFTGDYSVMSTSAAWLGTIAYTLQIYLDFSGYSDMAIGLGKIFGFHFPENFDHPYISTSIREFWRRWHMSLSRWFRDYLYIPLGGSRKGNVYLNLLIVFLATGIWHGAGWGFLFWGLWHGAFVMAERAISRRKVAEGQATEGKTTEGREETAKETEAKKPALRLLGWGYTMLVVMLGWTLFRIVDIRPFAKYLSVLLGFGQGEFTAFGLRYYLSNQRIFYLILSLIVAMPVGPQISKWLSKATGKSEAASLALDVAGKILVLALLILCYIYIINSTYNPFIYFRF